MREQTASSTDAIPQVPSFRPDGSVMDMLNPQPSDIVWSEVAASLSKIARFNARYRCPAFSDAQHCVLGADAIFNETGDALAAGYFVLHDAHECILGDITRPAVAAIEHHYRASLPAALRNAMHDETPVKTAIDNAKAAIDRVIYKAAGLPPLASMQDLHSLVREMDDRMLRAEGIALFGEQAADHLPAAHLPPPKLAGIIKPWGPMKAEEAWLERLNRYLGLSARPACEGAA